MDQRLRAKLLGEFLGTFFLVFAGTGAIVINDVSHGAITHPGIALTFGLVVMAMIHAFGDVSGAHLNPAVTIGFCRAGVFDRSLLVPYILTQCVGALAASFLLRVMFPDHPTLGGTNPAGSWDQSFLLEFILTAALMLVILAVATGPREKGLLASVAIGGTVALEAMFAGPICGASMNPARSLGPAVASGRLGSLWIYLVATTLGAIAAVVLHQQLHPVSSPAPETAPQ